MGVGGGGRGLRGEGKGNAPFACCSHSSPLASRLSPLAALPGLRWIRLLYCYPSYFSPALIEAIGCTLPRGIEPRSTIKWYQTRGPRAESYGHWTDGATKQQSCRARVQNQCRRGV